MKNRDLQATLLMVQKVWDAFQPHDTPGFNGPRVLPIAKKTLQKHEKATGE